MDHAFLEAKSTFLSGQASIEACQAYILLAFYPNSTRQSKDKRWFFLRCAIRMAIDIGLHRPPILANGDLAVTLSAVTGEEGQSREVLNRARCWIGCFNADKIMSVQFGIPTSLKEGYFKDILIDY